MLSVVELCYLLGLLTMFKAAAECLSLCFGVLVPSSGQKLIYAALTNIQTH